MRNPHYMQHEDLANLVEGLQRILYCDKDGKFLPNKRWDMDTLGEIGALAHEYDLKKSDVEVLECTFGDDDEIVGSFERVANELLTDFCVHRLERGEISTEFFGYDDNHRAKLLFRLEWRIGETGPRRGVSNNDLLKLNQTIEQLVAERKAEEEDDSDE